MITSPAGDPQVPAESLSRSLRPGVSGGREVRYAAWSEFAGCGGAVQEAFTEAWAFLTARPERWSEIYEPRGKPGRSPRGNTSARRGNRRQPLPVPVGEVDEIREGNSRPEPETGHDKLTVGTLLFSLRYASSILVRKPSWRSTWMGSPPGRSRPIWVLSRDDKEARDPLKQASGSSPGSGTVSRDQERRDS